ncbi:MAG: hypothetical protein H0X65_12115 [Gemmatimonadetes bacterium]|nr:hypothetical protein [Gemmatimonadota bacterium]
MNIPSLKYVPTLLAIVALGVLLRPVEGPAVVAAPPTAASEVARIRNHLQTVEGELLARDVSHLTPEQRADRVRHIAVLREYRERGAFPHNHHFPGERVPVFVDEHGTHCAMGYLIARSGNEALVALVASTRNYAVVPDLADEPGLIAWLDEAGLTLAEAARIQPWYESYQPTHGPGTVTTPYAAGTALSNGLSGASIALNLTRSADAPRWPGVFGIATGMFGVALGANKLGDGGAPALLGALNAGVGALSVGLGMRTLLSVPGDKPGTRRSAEDRAAGGVSVTAAPLVTADAAGGAGVVLSVRF